MQTRDDAEVPWRQTRALVGQKDTDPVFYEVRLTQSHLSVSYSGLDPAPTCRWEVLTPAVMIVRPAYQRSRYGAAQGRE